MPHLATYPKLFATLHTQQHSSLPTTNRLYKIMSVEDVWKTVCQLHQQHSEKREEYAEAMGKLCESIQKNTDYKMNRKMDKQNIRRWLYTVFHWLTKWKSSGMIVLNFEYDDTEGIKKEDDEDYVDDEEDDDDVDEEEEDYVDDEEDEEDDDSIHTNTNADGFAPLALRIGSSSDATIHYDVDALNCTCTCPDFVHRQKAITHTTCKHIRQVLAHLYWLAYKNNKLPKDKCGYRLLPVV